MRHIDLSGQLLSNKLSLLRAERIREPTITVNIHVAVVDLAFFYVEFKRFSLQSPLNSDALR